MHYTRKCFIVVVFLALGMTYYVILYSHASINSVKKINITQLQVEKNYQRFPSIQRKRSESDSVILTNLRRGRSLTNATYNRFRNAFISKRKNRGIPQNSAKQNLTLSKTLNSKMHLNEFFRNYSINSNPMEVKHTHVRTTNNIGFSFNSIQRKTPCRIVFNQRSLEAARKKLSDSKGGVLFFVIINDDDFLNFFTKQEQDGLFHWQYVKKKGKYLVQLPVDFDLVTYFIITNDNEEFVLYLDLVYKNTACAENFLETLRSVKELLWNKLFHNATDFLLCNRYFQDQPFRNLFYWITTTWVGYDMTCSEMLFTDEKLRMHEYIVEKDLLSYVVSWVTFYLSFQFIWIFALLDLSKDPRTSLKFYRKNDRPYGIKRFISELLFMECPCISKNRPCEPKQCLMKLPHEASSCKCLLKTEISEENKSYRTDPVNRLLLLTWGFILLPFGVYRTLGRYLFLNANFFKSYVEVIKPSEPLCSIISSDIIVVIMDFLIAIFVPLVFVCTGHHLYEAFITNKFCTCICACNKETSVDEYIPLLPSANCNPESNRQENATNSKISYIFVKPLYDLFHSLYSLVTCKCFKDGKCCRCFICCFKCCCCSEEYWEYDQNITFSCDIIRAGGKYFLNFLRNLSYCLFPIIPFIWNQRCTCLCDHGTCCEYCRKKCTKNHSTCKVICFISTLIYLRPIISTFTFILRSFTYFVFVALLIRIHLMRYALIIVSILVYILRYVNEFINMNVDILNYIICLETKFSKTTETTFDNDNDDSVEKINKEKFDNVYRELFFVKRRLYFLCFKVLIVTMYLVITIILFTNNRESLMGENFKDNLEVLLFIIGPYAVAFVLKTDKGDYLSEENKSEIKDIYDLKYTIHVS